MAPLSRPRGRWVRCPCQSELFVASGERPVGVQRRREVTAAAERPREVERAVDEPDRVLASTTMQQSASLTVPAKRTIATPVHTAVKQGCDLVAAASSRSARFARNIRSPTHEIVTVLIPGSTAYRLSWSRVLSFCTTHPDGPFWTAVRGSVARSAPAWHKQSRT